MLPRHHNQFAFHVHVYKSMQHSPGVDPLAQFQDQSAPMRIGFTTTLVDGFQDVEWFGRGPHESYLDRHASARVAFYQQSILEQTVKYVRPQENGNKFQTRWMALKRKQSDPCNMLLIAAQDPSIRYSYNTFLCTVIQFNHGFIMILCFR